MNKVDVLLFVVAAWFFQFGFYMGYAVACYIWRKSKEESHESIR